MTTKDKLVLAVKAIDYALQELDGIAEMLNDTSLQYSYTDISKAVGLLEKCYAFAKEERGDLDCPECGGTGEVIAQERVNSASIDIPYKTCTNCYGRKEIEE